MTSSKSSASSVRVACIQNSAGDSFDANLDEVHRLVRQAASRRPDIIALPENFVWRGDSSGLSAVAAKTAGILKMFKALAKSSRADFLLGSVLEASGTPGWFYNTAFWISASGRIASAYRKIHLFDVAISKKLTLRESRHILAGHKPVIVQSAGFKCGLSICYDLRFPELYRKLSAMGAHILFIPANFTFETGRAHWELLVRARAVENQCFVVAPAQTGVNPASGIASYGHSLIVDPWGKILREGPAQRSGVLVADLPMRRLMDIRKRLPALKHRVL